MKSGMMEVADIFAVNKTDRPGAETFIKNLKAMIMPNTAQGKMIPVVKLVASKKEGINTLFTEIQNSIAKPRDSKRKQIMLAEKAWQLLQQKKMAHYSKPNLISTIEERMNDVNFNIYGLVEELLATASF